MKTIALFGGSFDPPHTGHIAIVNALKRLDYIDKIVVMPTYLNPFKSKSAANATLRLKWLREIFKGDDRVLIDDFEVKQNRSVATIESVIQLLETYEKVYLVLGADNLASLKKWHRYDELKDLVTFIVASRDDIKIDTHYIKIKVDEPISSSVLRKELDVSRLPSECKDEILKVYKDKI
jgi:nicotinate-nucleotide adenylyltransferase